MDIWKKLKGNVLCLYLFMIDSGGGLNLRNVALIVIFLFAIKGVIRYSIPKRLALTYSIFMLSLIIPVLVSMFSGISFSIVLSWLFGYFLVPIFYYYCRASSLKKSDFLYAGAAFAITIILLFFGRLLQIPAITSIHEFISNRSDGYFGMKHFVSGDVLPNVYFQGTLSLIICGVLSLFSKRYWIYILIIVALVLAPSRFGVMVLIMCFVYIFAKRSIKNSLLIPIIAVPIIILLNNLAFGKELFSIFTGESDATSIRSGHLNSIIREFNKEPIYFLTGFGPGSEFFTEGTYERVSNIEISQIEYIRKFGFVSFICFLIFYFGTMFSRKDGLLSLNAALLAYFITAFSNPVLSAVFLLLFLSFTYTQEIELNENHE